VTAEGSDQHLTSAEQKECP